MTTRSKETIRCATLVSGMIIIGFQTPNSVPSFDVVLADPLFVQVNMQNGRIQFSEITPLSPSSLSIITLKESQFLGFPYSVEDQIASAYLQVLERRASAENSEVQVAEPVEEESGFIKR